MKQVIPLTLQHGMSQSDSYILMLCEPTGGIQIPIFIGAHEAQGILLAKENVTTRRPMTHELIVQIMNDYQLTLKEVTIDKVSEGIFYSTLHMTDGFNTKNFDSRTSDAITLALLCGCPIMAAEEVLEETGVKMDNPTFSPTPATPDEELTNLEQELRACEEKEEYERAAEIQQKIEELKNNKL